MDIQYINITQNLIKNKDAVLIYFSSINCAACSSLRPKVLNMLQLKFPKMNYEFIDAESAPEIAVHFNVFSSPTILIFFDGKENKRFSKFVSMQELEQSVSRSYNLIFNSY